MRASQREWVYKMHVHFTGEGKRKQKRERKIKTMNEIENKHTNN
jgi:hypothetical protein